MSKFVNSAMQLYFTEIGAVESGRRGTITNFACFCVDRFSYGSAALPPPSLSGGGGTLEAGAHAQPAVAPGKVVPLSPFETPDSIAFLHSAFGRECRIPEQSTPAIQKRGVLL